jgi:hypothetical protein
MSWLEDMCYDGYDDSYDDSTESIYLGQMIRETDKAYLFRDRKGGFWIPKSLIIDMEASKAGNYSAEVLSFFDKKYIEPLFKNEEQTSGR